MVTHNTLHSASEQIASALLDIGAIRLSPSKPYKWASGWLSPIYCDNRLSLSFPQTRMLIKNSLVALIKEKFADVEAIAGVATAGIPQGVLIAEVLNLPFIYVRPKPKDHGMENLIEGKIVPGQKVVVIEDLISTGGSSLKAVEALRESDIQVMGMAAIFTYGFDVAAKNFETSKVTLYSLSNYYTLVKLAAEKGYIKENEMNSLSEWRNAPDKWGK
ncbi:MAG TPA: orotate phosphoribosyltransferase [Cytophagaceae bacterium]|jgi:orotate phosphoribosyltransferase|nr:orotate phosphoribosyltransferase [Cytophagaceae bacterium]